MGDNRQLKTNNPRLLSCCFSGWLSLQPMAHRNSNEFNGPISRATCLACARHSDTAKMLVSVPTWSFWDRSQLFLLLFLAREEVSSLYISIIFLLLAPGYVNDKYSALLIAVTGPTIWVGTHGGATREAEIEHIEDERSPRAASEDDRCRYAVDGPYIMPGSYKYTIIHRIYMQNICVHKCS